MIHVIELPPGAPPRAWFAFDADDLVGKTAQALDESPWVIWDRTSVRELLGAEPGVEPDGDGPPALLALGRAQGWDAPLYRADALLGAGVLETEPVDPLAACAAALSGRRPARVYADDAAAMAAFERGDAEFAEPGQSGWHGRWALRQQLIALDILADDV